MPSHPERFHRAGDLHFLTFSYYHRQPLFSDPDRRDLFLETLERTRLRYRFVVLGYVVMPEHVHLLVSEPQRETLSTAIQALKLRFVQRLQRPWFPRLATTARRGASHLSIGTTPPEVIASGRRDTTISTFGRRRNESRSCATFTAIR